MTRWLLIALVLLALGCSSDRKFGGTCDSNADCADRCLTDFPDGLCTLSCSSDDDCTSDTICVDTEGGVCLAPCGSSAECRDEFGPGFACDDESTFDDRDVRVCEDSG